MRSLLRAILGLTLLWSPPAEGQIVKALQIMRNNRPPDVAFDPARAAPAPEYRSDDVWAALPETRDAADVAPLNLQPVDPKSAQVDVFFVYPTVFMSREAWNADWRDAAYRDQVANGPLRGQASVFNGCCRVFAPHYRQMTLGGFVKWSENSESAVALAYSDVERAFDEFVSRRAKGRPFILAGHSQGSRLLRTLIERRIEWTTHANRLVAAYLVGHWMEAEWFERPGALRACGTAYDTGCVITWSSFAEGRNATAQRLTLGRSSGYAPERERRPYVCINPLSWSTDGAVAPARLNRGAWLHGGGATPRGFEPGLVSARCNDGALYVSAPRQKIYTDLVIPFGNFHNLDYNMVYMNVRDNLPVRIGAFWKR
jgi:hypothetical protein